MNVPQEFDLERLTSGLHNRAASWTADRSACEWEGIACDADKLIKEVRWSGKKLTGFMKFQYIPRSVSSFDIEYNSVGGEIGLSDFSRLEELTDFFLGRNTFTGNPDLTELPQCLNAAWLERNKLYGDVCLTQLPADLWYLDISDNLLTEKLNFGALPRTLEALYLADNTFEGFVDFSFFPENLESLSLENNTLLEGTIAVSKLHPELQKNILKIVSNTNLVVVE